MSARVVIRNARWRSLESLCGKFSPPPLDGGRVWIRIIERILTQYEDFGAEASITCRRSSATCWFPPEPLKLDAIPQ